MISDPAQPGRDFARARQVGERLTCGCLIANWCRVEAQAHPRLGVVTSSRIGGAVVRNRARRLLRESFRRHQHDLSQPVDLVLVARSSIVGKGLVEVEKDFLTALRKARLLTKWNEDKPSPMDSRSGDSLLSLVPFASEDLRVRADGAVPLRAKLLDIRARSPSAPWRFAWQLAHLETDRPVPPLGRLRLGPGSRSHETVLRHSVVSARAFNR